MPTIVRKPIMSDDLTKFDHLELPDWVVPMKTFEKKLGHLEDEQVRKELVSDYQQFLLKLTDAFAEMKDDKDEKQPAVFDQSLGDSELTLGWLIQNVKTIAPPTVEIKQVHCEVLSTDGFVSQIFRIRLIGSNNNAVNIVVKLPETRAIKSAILKTVGPSMAEQYLPSSQLEPFARGLVLQFNRELDFYSINTVKGLKLPSIYFSQKWEYNKYTGALAMEDLSHMKSVSFFDTLNTKQITSLCEQLSILHVNSACLAPWWKDKFPHPESSMGVLCKLKDVVDVFVEKNPELKKQHSKLMHLYGDRTFLEYVLERSHKEIGLDDVLCHGDLWTYNFLWKTDAVGSPSDELGVIIDWQNVHVGSIGEDFGRLLVFCCDAITRRTAEREILPRYFEKVKQNIERKHGHWNCTLSQFMRAYRVCFVVHALHLPFIANVMLSIKPADCEMEQATRNQCLVNRTVAAWSDALEILETDLPAWRS